MQDDTEKTTPDTTAAETTPAPKKTARKTTRKTTRKRRTVADVEAEAKKREEELQRKIEQLEAATSSQRQHETVMLSVRVPRRLREQAKHLGSLIGMSMQEVASEALTSWVEEKVGDRDPGEFIAPLFPEDN